MAVRPTNMLLIFILSVSPACSKNPTAAELARLNHDLYQATDHRDLSPVRRLLDKGANIEATGDNEMTPLGAAAGNGDLPMVQFLLQKGANPHAKDHSLETPLMHAAYDGHQRSCAYFSSRIWISSRRTQHCLKLLTANPRL